MNMLQMKVYICCTSNKGFACQMRTCHWYSRIVMARKNRCLLVRHGDHHSSHFSVTGSGILRIILYNSNSNSNRNVTFEFDLNGFRGGIIR